jgi:hypothetical protein
MVDGNQLCDLTTAPKPYCFIGVYERRLSLNKVSTSGPDIERLVFLAQCCGYAVY